MLFLFAINALLLEVPHLVGQSINSIAHQDAKLPQYIGLFVLIVALVMALKFVSRHLVLGSIRHLEYYLRKEIFDKALHIKTGYYEKYGPGKVMALMTNDVTSIRVALGLGIMILVDTIFFGIFAFLIMGHEISFGRTILTLSPMIPVVIITLYLTQYMRKRQREAQTSFSELTEFVQELFMGMQVVRAFNKELRAASVFQERNRNNYQKNMKVALLDAIVGPLTLIAPFACIALNIYSSGMLVVENQLSIGEFVAMNGYLILMIGPLMSLGSLATVTQKGLASVDRISDFMKEPEEVIGREEGVLPLADITVENLTFQYPDTTHDALQNVSVTIPKGSFVGIVGRPGAGKSTFFKLLLRLQDTPAKSIFVGNEDVCDMPLEVLRRSFAYVPQTSYIHSTTVTDNIAFGETPKEMTTVTEAAERAQIHLELTEKVKNEGSKLKEGGRNLSGGQKQRLSLARGFYKKAPYLLLDDAFSALDFETAQKISEQLRGHREQTLLFISQRLESICKADLILVFREGVLVEQGTHEALMQVKGEYYQLFEQQRKGGI